MKGVLFALFPPPASLVLRSVSLWEDFFCRHSPRHSFTHLPFVSRASHRRGTLGGTLYDEHHVDSSEVPAPDLKLAEAACRGADWEAFLEQATLEADRWRAKAHKEKMRMLQVAADDSDDNSHGDGATTAKAAAATTTTTTGSAIAVSGGGGGFGNDDADDAEATAKLMADKDLEIDRLRELVQNQERQIEALTKGTSSAPQWRTPVV